MKRIVIVIVLIWATFEFASARPYRMDEIPNVQLSDRHHYTSNPDNILSAEAVRAIDTACDSLRTKGLAQIAVVAVRDIASDDVFTFAHQLFSSWGVGLDKADNGLGIILVLDKREIRFVTGYGLEGVLPDALCKRIQQQYMVEPLGRGDYDTGMVAGVSAVANLLSNGELPAYGEEELTNEDIILILCSTFALLAVIAIITFMVQRAYRKCPKCGKYTLQQSNQQIIEDKRTHQLIATTLTCQHCGNSIIRHNRVDKGGVIIIGGGNHRGGGFGGGFGGGGFGGGSFGGGGAGSRF